MLSRIKKILCFVIFYSGIVRVLSFIIHSIYGNPICIIYMHRVIDRSQSLYPFLLKAGHLGREDYERKMRHLSKRYRVISLRQCLDYLEKGNSRLRKCFVITFDDGHRDLYRNAFPILREKNIPATVFLVAGLMDSREMTWFDKVEYMILKTEVTQFQIPEVSDRTYLISSDDERIGIAVEVKERLKKLNSDSRDAIIEKMAEILRIDLSDCEDGYSMLSWKEIVEMGSSGSTDFQSHGMSHPILTNECEENVEYELGRSREIIEGKLGKRIFAFAYPNGDFNKLIKDNLTKLGYSCAVSTIPGVNNEEMDLMELRRSGDLDGPLYSFGVKMACLPWLLRRGHRKSAREHGEERSVCLPAH